MLLSSPLLARIGISPYYCLGRPSRSRLPPHALSTPAISCTAHSLALATRADTHSCSAPGLTGVHFPGLGRCSVRDLFRASAVVGTAGRNPTIPRPQPRSASLVARSNRAPSGRSCHKRWSSKSSTRTGGPFPTSTSTASHGRGWQCFRWCRHHQPGWRGTGAMDARHRRLEPPAPRGARGRQQYGRAGCLRLLRGDCES